MTDDGHYFSANYMGEAIDTNIYDIRSEADFGMTDKHIDEYAREFLGGFNVA